MNFNPPKSDTIRRAAPYTILAQVYDRMMMHVNYRKWAEYIVAILKTERFWPEKKLLDIGCGTGRFLEEVQRLGQAGDGCDPSREMLEIARNRLLYSRIFQSCLPEITEIPSAVYPAFTCLYDTMNYLADKATFTRSLINIFDKMPAPGIFIFDLVSEAHCKYYFRNYRDSEVLSDNVAYSRESHYDSKENCQHNWIRIYLEEGIFEEAHQQRIYDFRDIQKLIREDTDFEVKHIYDEFTFKQATPRSGRAHFVLKKN